MPEAMNQGPLSQTASPAQAMVPAASGGNSMVSDMLSSLLAGNQQKQSYLEQQQAAYNKEMERYAQMVEQSRNPETQEAAIWGGMANAAASVAPTWGNVGAMLGRVGGAYGTGQEAQQQSNLKNQAALTKMRQDEVRAIESKDQNAAMIRALGGAAKVSAPTIKVVDGKLVAAKWDPVTQTYNTEVLTGSQDQIKARLYQNFYNKAVAAELPNPEEYAQQQTEKTLSQFGGTTVKGEANAIPGVKSSLMTTPEMKITPEVQTSRDVEAGRIRKGEVTGELPAWPTLPSETKLSPEDAATVARLQARIQANPQTAQNDAATLQGILSKYEKPTAKPLTYLDKPTRVMEEETAKVAGKSLGEEHQALNTGYRTSGQQLSNLDLLEKLFSNPNMPEGELGPLEQRLRSGLKSLGIEVGEEVGQAGLVDALAKEIALKKRTEGGQNLLPGAMSNYEDTLLQSMSPGLLSTSEGRLAQIQLMKAVAKSNMRFAEEANKMAAANKGRLPPEWNTRKERIVKEEMARLADVNRSIMTLLKGAK